MIIMWHERDPLTDQNCAVCPNLSICLERNGVVNCPYDAEEWRETLSKLESGEYEMEEI